MSDVDIRAARPTDLTRVLHLASAFYIEDGFATPVSELRDNLVVLLHTGTARVAVASRQPPALALPSPRSASDSNKAPSPNSTTCSSNLLIGERESQPHSSTTAPTGSDHAAVAPWNSSSRPTAQMSPTSSATTPIKTSPTSAWSNVSPDGGGIRSALPCGR
jgi:hypothetical protein